LRAAELLGIVEEMSDSKPDSARGDVPPPVSEPPKLDPVTVLFALGSETRWAIVQLLADGRELTITGITAVVGGTAENISKQLSVLRDAGVVDWKKGEDRRQSVSYIPAARRPAPGVLNFDFCTIDLKQV
jgi:hypothetical protein